MNTTTERPSEELVRDAMVTLAGLLREHLYEYDRYSEIYPESMPTQAHHYTSPGDLIRDAQHYGHFFDDSTMRSFKTKVYDLVNERFLVISDANEWDGRTYRVAWIYQQKPSCDNSQHIHKSVQTTETRFKTLAKARKFAREMAELIATIERA